MRLFICGSPHMRRWSDDRKIQMSHLIGWGRVTALVLVRSCGFRENCIKIALLFTSRTKIT